MEDSTYLSGNAIVDEISQLRINSIPDCWYHNIKKNGQTQAMAILVLWDLLYWYKWTELRDEHTGLITGYKKKFAADLLQRSYSDIGAKFGITKRQATDVISFLAELGVLKKHLRTISFKNGLRCNNVLFIELIPSKIKEISNEKTAPIYTPTGTDESYTVEEEEVSRNDVTPSHEKMSDLYTSKRETNTTNTTTTSTNNSTTDTTSKNSEQEEKNNNQESNSHCCGETATKNKKSSLSFKNSEYTRVYDAYYENCRKLFEQGRIKCEHPVLPNYFKRTIKKAFESFGVEQVVSAVVESINHDWLVGQGYPFAFIFGPSELPNLINKTYKNSNYSNKYFDKSKLDDKPDLSYLDVSRNEDDYEECPF